MARTCVSKYAFLSPAGPYYAMSCSNKENRLVVITDEIPRSEFFCLLLLCHIHRVLRVNNPPLPHRLQLGPVVVIDADGRFLRRFNRAVVFLHIERTQGRRAHVEMLLRRQLRITAIPHCHFFEDDYAAFELGIQNGCGSAVVDIGKGLEQFTADSTHVNGFDAPL